MSAVSRRSFLSLLGIGAAGIVAPVLVEPFRRKVWQVHPNTPIRSSVRTYNVAEIRVNGVSYGTGRNVAIDLGGPDYSAECTFTLDRDSDLNALRNFHGRIEFEALDMPWLPRFVGRMPEPQADGSVLLTGDSLSPALAMRRQIEDRVADWERRGFVGPDYAEAFKRELVRL